MPLVRKLPRWCYDGHEINATTVEEVLHQGDLNWTVSKRPIATTADGPQFATKKDINPVTLHPNGTPRTRNLKNAIQQLLCAPHDIDLQQKVREALEATRNEFLVTSEQYAVVRNDNNHFITTVGKVYTPLENSLCIGVLENLMNEYGCVVQRAGVFNNGASCWVIANLPLSLVVANDDIDQYIRIGWSHDGSEKLAARFLYVSSKTGLVISPVLKDKKIPVEISIRHTKTGPERAIDASDIIKKQHKHAAALESIADEMVNTECENFREYLKSLFPKCDENKVTKHGEDIPNKDSVIVSDLEEALRTQDSETANTLWGAYLAVTDYVDNKRTVRIHGKDENISEEENEKLKNEMRNRNAIRSDGAAMKMKQKAWSLLTAPLGR
jgi:hypothetical protein